MKRFARFIQFLDRGQWANKKLTLDFRPYEVKTIKIADTAPAQEE